MEAARGTSPGFENCLDQQQVNGRDDIPIPVDNRVAPMAGSDVLQAVYASPTELQDVAHTDQTPKSPLRIKKDGTHVHDADAAHADQSVDVTPEVRDCATYAHNAASESLGSLHLREVDFWDMLPEACMGAMGRPQIPLPCMRPPNYHTAADDEKSISDEAHPNGQSDDAEHAEEESASNAKEGDQRGPGKKSCVVQ
jgi:hypothetical protein